MHAAASLLSMPLWLPVSVCRWYQGTVQGPDGKLLPGAWKRCGQGLLGCEVAVAASLIGGAASPPRAACSVEVVTKAAGHVHELKRPFSSPRAATLLPLCSVGQRQRTHHVQQRADGGIWVQVGCCCFVGWGGAYQTCLLACTAACCTAGCCCSATQQAPTLCQAGSAYTHPINKSGCYLLCVAPQQQYCLPPLLAAAQLGGAAGK